jgi:hypothetical protein
MRRIVSVVSLVLAFGLLAQVIPAGAVTTAQVKSKTLSLSNMPTGWSVDHSTSGGLSNTGGCISALQSLKRPAKSTVRAHVQYEDQSLPAVQETLEAGKGAVARYDKFLKTLNACTSVSFTFSGQSIKGTVGAMSFPTVGDSSRGYAMNFTFEGESFGLDTVFFRVGQYDGDLEYIDHSPEADTVRAFVQEAVAKIEGKTVTVPTT